MKGICEIILSLRSESSGREFPAALLSGDTDMVTAGWVSLSSVEQKVVVLAQLTPAEHRAMEQSVSGLAAVERRVNGALGRQDLRCNWLVRAEDSFSAKPGQSFQAFKKAYKPPKLFYRDITSADGTAVEVSRTSVGEFKREGGQVLVCSEVQQVLQADAAAQRGLS